jgi:hypothetical protein
VEIELGEVDHRDAVCRERDPLRMKSFSEIHIDHPGRLDLTRPGVEDSTWLLDKAWVLLEKQISRWLLDVVWRTNQKVRLEHVPY